MRKVYRHEDNRGYWDRRWAEAGRDRAGFDRLDVYPIKYAEMVMGPGAGKVLEIGVGLGRVLKHYRRQGHDIVGVERSEVACRVLLAEDSTTPVVRADVKALPYPDAWFDVVLAFGVYHNIEQGMERALAETARVLKPGGGFCLSMRPDNLEMRLNEFYWRGKRRGGAAVEPRFHKWLVEEDEFRRALAGHGLLADAPHRARNVSILYRLPFLRQAGAEESENRSRGYRLNAAGRGLDALLTKAFPRQFCNVLVYMGRKEGA